jgi:hypothetical protein
MRVGKALDIASRGAIILGLLLVSLSLVPAAPTTAQIPPLINEIRIDQPDSDVDEYFELVGPGGASLDGLTYLVIGDGPTGTIECVLDLTGYSIPADGFFVVAEDTFSPTLGIPDLVLVPNALNFENSDNVTHLLVDSFTGILGTDVDTDDDCTMDVTPWAEIVDLIALVEEDNPPSGTECHYGPPQIGPDGIYVPSHVYRCAVIGAAQWWMGVHEMGVTDTPGAANYSCPTTAVQVSSLGATSAGLPGLVIGLAAMLTGGGVLAFRRRRR